MGGNQWVGADGTTTGGWNTDADSELTGTWWRADNIQGGTWSSVDIYSDVKTTSITFNITSGVWAISDGCSMVGTWEHDTLESTGSFSIPNLDGTYINGGFNLGNYYSDISGSWWTDDYSFEGTWNKNSVGSTYI